MVFKKARRYARKAYGKIKRYSHANKGINPMEIGIGSAVYGVARAPIASVIPDFAQLGGYSDSVILGGLGALAAWRGRGLMKKAGMVMLANEAFVASARASQGSIGGSSQTNGIYIN